MIAAAALTACGGGGSSDDAAAPVANATVPLALTASNTQAVAGFAPSIGESVLTVAQFAVDSVRRFAQPGNASPVVQTCPNGGLLTVTLVDHDGNGVASAGDHLSVEAHDCTVPVITDIVNGTFEIELGRPTSTPADTPSTSLHATVSLGNGLTIGTGGTVALLGSLQIDWSATDWRTALHVTAASTDDLRLVVSAGGQSVHEAIRQPDLAKTLNDDDARAVVTLAFRYESEALGGSIGVSTPQPLLAYLNTYPETGRIEVIGAQGAKIVLTPNYVTNSAQYNFVLDNATTAGGAGSINWSDSTIGYLWWDGTTPPSGGSQVISPRPFATTDFYSSLNFTWTGAATAVYRLQFSRPVAATTPTLYARFQDLGSIAPSSTELVNVDASVEQRGALVIARPKQPLQHGRYYSLLFSLDGTNWTTSVTVQDALGNSTTLYSGQSLATPDGLHAAASADATVLLAASDLIHLSAANSIAGAHPIVAYQWTQLSGTPLSFDTPTASETKVSWGATSPSGIESPVIRLTVTDASGDVDVTQLTIKSGNLAAGTHALYFRSTAGDYIGQGQTALFGDASAQFQESVSNGYLSASVITPGYAEWWYLNLATSDGSPLRVGAYENAIRAPFHGTQNGLEMTGDGRGCNEISGRFDVLEIQIDGTGAITKLAVDFEQHCEIGSAPALLGSYRVNSAVPIRR